MSKSIYVNARHFFIGTTGFIVQAIKLLDIYALKNELNLNILMLSNGIKSEILSCQFY